MPLSRKTGGSCNRPIPPLLCQTLPTLNEQLRSYLLSRFRIAQQQQIPITYKNAADKGRINFNNDPLLHVAGTT